MHGRRCAKHWHRVGGNILCDSYGNESHWAVASYHVPTVDALYLALKEISGVNVAIVIRGAVKEGVLLPSEGLRRQVHGENAPFKAEPRRWVALDLDGLSAPDGATIAWVVSQLPPAWQSASCVYQFTSSHGMEGPGTLRLRLWFMLDAAVSDAAWRGYWAPAAEALHLDVALFRAVQPHYVASPTFDGVPNPVQGARIGLHLGTEDFVRISMELTEPERLLEQVGGVACEVLPAGLSNRQQIESTLERISNQATSGARHHHLLGAAAELVGIGCPYDVAVPTLEALVRRQGREPQPNELRNAWSHAEGRLMEGTLRTDNPPVASLFPALATEELPRTPEIQARVDAETQALTLEVAEWSANDHLNARLYLRLHHPNQTLIRTAQIDYEWDKGFWRPLESDEVLLSRVIQRSGMKHSRCQSTAQSLRGLVSQERLAAPAWISTRTPAPQVVVFNNGILDVEKWITDPQHPQVFRDLTPDLFTHTQCPYDYEPEATCPTFDRFLESAFPGEPEAVRETLKMMGYLLTPDTKHQKMFILGGVPGSGKSTFANLIRKLVGPKACAAPTMSSLSSNFGPQSLLGKSVAIVAEANNGGDSKTVPMAAVDLIKRITGCDQVQIDRKFRDPVDVALPLRFVFACNRLPHFIDPSGAMARRIQLYWFKVSHVGRADIGLPARLDAELAGIANRALEGLKYLMEDGGFKPLASAAETLRNYVRQISPVSAFVDDCLDMGGTAPRAEVYQVYKAWCAETGRVPLGLDRLVGELVDAVPGVSETRPRGQGSRTRVLVGVQLTPAGREMLSSVGVF
jgi:putative DNA primase/helicase